MMASIIGLSSSSSLGVIAPLEQLNGTRIRRIGMKRLPRRTVSVRAAETINPEIRKSEDKVVDSVVVTQLSKPLTAYCRCWRSKTFPLCDGSHVKHNKATGDNVGPLLLKQQ